VVSFILQIIGL